MKYSEDNVATEILEMVTRTEGLVIFDLSSCNKKNKAHYERKNIYKTISEVFTFTDILKTTIQ